MRILARISAAALLAVALALPAAAEEATQSPAPAPELQSPSPPAPEVPKSEDPAPAPAPEVTPAPEPAPAPAPEAPAAEGPAVSPQAETPAPAPEGPPEKTPSIAELMVPSALGDRSLGDPAAPVTIIEYASMTCPHCRHFHMESFPFLKEKYIDTGRVRFILREFPLDNLALAVIMLARCAPEDKFFPVVSHLFDQQPGWMMVDNPGNALFALLQDDGFTADSFNACLQNQELLEGVVAERERGAQTFGVRATPTFFIDGKKEEGVLSQEDLVRILGP